MVLSLQGFFADSTGSSNTSHPENTNSAGTMCFHASPRTKDDGPNDVGKNEDDEENDLSRRASSRKRRCSSQSDAVRGLSNSTKRRHISRSPDLDGNQSHTMADRADPDDTPMVPRSISQSRNFTITASVASHDSRSATPPSSNNSSLGLPKDTALDAEESIERKNNQSRSSLDQNTTHRARSISTRPSSPTSDRGAWRRTNDQPDLAVKPEVEIFVIALFGSRMIIKKWPNETLTDMVLYNFFDEGSTRISRSDIQRVKFKLEALKKEDELEYLVERKDMVNLEVMIRKFNQRIKERKKAGETTLKMLLELYPSSEERQK